MVGGKSCYHSQWSQRWLVVWIVVALTRVPCATGGQPPHRSPAASRRLRQADGQEILLALTDHNNDGIEYNPCSICQGIDILADKTPFPETLPNTTCHELNSYFEQAVGNETVADYLVGVENATHQTALVHEHAHFEIHPETCRADPLFNQLFDRCCRASVPVYQCEENVHDYLFDRRVGYNAAVPPIVNPDEKLHVSVFLQYEALEEIKVEEGTVTIFVSLDLTWKDPRLKWDVDDFDTCANLVDVWTGHDVETASIWVPDFNLLNNIEGVQDMPESKANVYADGTVVWALSGALKAFCGFKGLATIPFDVLGCQLFLGTGTRLHSDLIVYDLETPEYLFFGAFDMTYNEFHVVPELGDQGHVGGSIYYDVYFKRATQHYIQNIVIPTVILTYLSFFTFLLDMRVGERLGFGMALALVVVAQQIVTSGMTPISDQKLWLDKFVAWSFYWVLVGVIQSVLIGFLYYIREDKQSKEQRPDEGNIYEGREMGDDEEELEPLKPQKPAAVATKELSATFNSSVALSVGTKEARKELRKEPHKENCLVALWKGFLFRYPLRMMDIVALVICIATYTAFIIIMLSSGSTGSWWLQNEPEWFHEDFLDSYKQTPYINGDPEK